MRRLLVLSCVTVLFGVLVAVAPAIVRPDANRAEAVVACDGGIGPNQTVARHGPWAATVWLCVEVLGSGVRPGVKVYCDTASLTPVPCNWDFHPLRLKNQDATVIHFEVAHETGKTNGAYIATPNWVSRSRCTYAYSDSPQLKVRFPDGYLSPSVTARWRNLPFVHC